LRQLGGVAAEFVGDCQAGRVVARRIDAVAAGQALNGLVLKVAVNAQVFLRNKGIDVSLYGKRRRRNPFCLVADILFGKAGRVRVRRVREIARTSACVTRLEVSDAQ
jgi:hypothetical protein